MTSRPENGSSCPIFTLAEAQNVFARVVAAREELAYEPIVAAAMLANLEVDLAAAVAAMEGGLTVGTSAPGAS